MNARILLALSIACLSELSVSAFSIENRLDKEIIITTVRVKNPQNWDDPRTNFEGRSAHHFGLYTAGVQTPFEKIIIKPNQTKNIPYRFSPSSDEFELSFVYNNKYYGLRFYDEHLHDPMQHEKTIRLDNNERDEIITEIELKNDETFQKISHISITRGEIIPGMEVLNHEGNEINPEENIQR